MRLDIYVHPGEEHPLPSHRVLERLNAMSAQMDTLIAQVAATKQVTDSAIVLLNGLRQQIIDAGVDQTKLTELTNSLKTETDELAAAVTTNTPSA